MQIFPLLTLTSLWPFHSSLLLSLAIITIIIIITTISTSITFIAISIIITNLRRVLWIRVWHLRDILRRRDIRITVILVVQQCIWSEPLCVICNFSEVVSRLYIVIMRIVVLFVYTLRGGALILRHIRLWLKHIIFVITKLRYVFLINIIFDTIPQIIISAYCFSRRYVQCHCVIAVHRCYVHLLAMALLSGWCNGYGHTLQLRRQLCPLCLSQQVNERGQNNSTVVMVHSRVISTCICFFFSSSSFCLCKLCVYLCRKCIWTGIAAIGQKKQVKLLFRQLWQITTHGGNKDNFVTVTNVDVIPICACKTLQLMQVIGQEIGLHGKVEKTKVWGLVFGLLQQA